MKDQFTVLIKRETLYVKHEKWKRILIKHNINVKGVTITTNKKFTFMERSSSKLYDDEELKHEYIY